MIGGGVDRSSSFFFFFFARRIVVVVNRGRLKYKLCRFNFYIWVVHITYVFFFFFWRKLCVHFDFIVYRSGVYTVVLDFFVWLLLNFKCDQSRCSGMESVVGHFVQARKTVLGIVSPYLAYPSPIEFDCTAGIFLSRRKVVLVSRGLLYPLQTRPSKRLGRSTPQCFFRCFGLGFIWCLVYWWFGGWTGCCTICP